MHIITLLIWAINLTILCLSILVAWWTDKLCGSLLPTPTILAILEQTLHWLRLRKLDTLEFEQWLRGSTKILSLWCLQMDWLWQSLLSRIFILRTSTKLGCLLELCHFEAVTRLHLSALRLATKIIIFWPDGLLSLTIRVWLLFLQFSSVSCRNWDELIPGNYSRCVSTCHIWSLLRCSSRFLHYNESWCCCRRCRRLSTVISNLFRLTRAICLTWRLCNVKIGSLAYERELGCNNFADALLGRTFTCFISDLISLGSGLSHRHGILLTFIRCWRTLLLVKISSFRLLCSWCINDHFLDDRCNDFSLIWRRCIFFNIISPCCADSIGIICPAFLRHIRIHRNSLFREATFSWSLSFTRCLVVVVIIGCWSGWCTRIHIVKWRSAHRFASGWCNERSLCRCLWILIAWYHYLHVLWSICLSWTLTTIELRMLLILWLLLQLDGLCGEHLLPSGDRGELLLSRWLLGLLHRCRRLLILLHGCLLLHEHHEGLLCRLRDTSLSLLLW